MADPMMFEAPSGRRIAYHKTDGTGPGFVFLGGFMSDMDGTKAVALEAWAREEGRAFLRFDYSGHGASSEAFTDGAISDWAQDAADIIGHATTGPQILIGSSMGGWISLLLARSGELDIAGMVTIAAAPDFTEDGFWSSFGEDARQQLRDDGVVRVPSEYGDPYPITRRLIEDGRSQLVLRDPLRLDFPVRLLQGDRDEDVSVETAMRLFSHLDCPDLRLVLLKGGDHRFSDPDALQLIKDALNNVLSRLSD